MPVDFGLSAAEAGVADKKSVAIIIDTNTFFKLFLICFFISFSPFTN